MFIAVSFRQCCKIEDFVKTLKRMTEMGFEAASAPHRLLRQGTEHLNKYVRQINSLPVFTHNWQFSREINSNE